MSRIVESLKRLNVENDAEAYEQDNEKVGKNIELTLSLEVVSFEENYILSVCGTQRQILYFFVEHFMSNLRKNMTHVLEYVFIITRCLKIRLYIHCLIYSLYIDQQVIFLTNILSIARNLPIFFSTPLYIF